MSNKYHTDIQPTNENPPSGLPKAVSPSPTPSKEVQPPYKGPAGPEGSGYPSIYPKVKQHVQKKGI